MELKITAVEQFLVDVIEIAPSGRSAGETRKSVVELKITAVDRSLVDVPLEVVAERNMVRTQPEWSISEICKVLGTCPHRKE